MHIPNLRGVFAPAALCLSLPAVCLAQQGGAEVPLPDVTVTAPPPTATRYDPPASVTGTKTNTPLIDVPQSVTPLSGRLLQDQGVVQFSQALDNAAGVVSGAGETSLYPEFTQTFLIRGFQARVFLDTIAQRYWYDADPDALTDIERIDILRGPSTVLYGGGGQGGVVDLVTRAPSATLGYTASLGLGSYGRFQQVLGATGPVTQDGKLTYRVNFEHERTGTFVDTQKIERTNGTVDLLWDNRDGTTLRLTLDDRERAQRYDYGQPTGTAARLPRGSYFGEPGIDHSTNSGQLATAVATHDFGDGWAAALKLRFGRVTFASPSAFPTALEADGATLDRTYITSREEDIDYVGEADVTKRFLTGPVKHTLLLGFEHKTLQDRANTVSGSIASINVLAPVYGATPFNTALTLKRHERFQSYGAFAEDQADLTDRLHFLIGARFDDYEDHVAFAAGGTSYATSRKEGSVRTGLAYEFVPNLSAFVGYGQGNSPVLASGFSYTGQPARPETGDQVEVGLKAQNWHGLSGTASFFQITRQGVQTPSLVLPNTFTQTGEQRSCGFDADLRYAVTKDLSALLAYAYTDAQVTQDNVFPAGSRVPNVPHQQVRAWAWFEPHDRVPGLGLGAGVRYVGQRAGDLPNTFTLNSFATVDAAVSYTWRNYTASVSGRNLLNRRYAAFSNGPTQVFPGEPAQVFARLSAAF